MDKVIMDFLKETIDGDKYHIIPLVSLASILIYMKRNYLSGTRYSSLRRLDGKTVIITGNNFNLRKLRI